MKKRLKNFEIPLNCAEDIKKFADFFGFTEITMTKLLFGMGYRAHKYNPETVRVYKMLETANQRKKNRIKKRKLEIKEKERKFSKLGNKIEEIKKNRHAYKEAGKKIAEYESKQAELSDDINELALQLKLELEREKVSQRKRGKIHITIEQADYIKEAVQCLNNSQPKYYESDIIYSFIRYGLRELEYISLPKYWDSNLLTDPVYSEMKKMRFEIPNIFYRCLQKRAEQFNVEVRDYIVLLIEEKFDEDRKEMRKSVLEDNKKVLEKMQENLAEEAQKKK